MEKRTKSASEAWLEARAPGFQDLPDEDRRTIFDFAFLWSLFEAEIMGANASVDRITEKADAWVAADPLGADLYYTELAYFRDRYFANGELTYHYSFLNLRRSDHPELVEAVIRGVNNDPRDRMLALLIIVWRLRNNFFHGAKWAYQIKGQRENFIQANVVLMRVLECHGELA